MRTYFASVFEPSWISVSLGELDMEKLNLNFFYELGAQLRLLSTTFAEPGNAFRALIWQRAMQIAGGIVVLVKAYPALSVCTSAANELLVKINDINDWANKATKEDWNKPDLTVDGLFIGVIQQAKTFETVLTNELPTLEVYHTTQKGNYNTKHLITQAEKVLPDSLLTKIDDKVKEDIRSSAKCLVFDNFTASGFHILRATEAVLKQYYLTICKPDPVPKKLDSWGWADYIGELYKSTDPQVKKMVAVLQQIKDLDRNLIAHPEIFLSEDDARVLFEAGNYAIMQMARDLPQYQPVEPFKFTEIKAVEPPKLIKIEAVKPPKFTKIEGIQKDKTDKKD